MITRGDVDELLTGAEQMQQELSRTLSALENHKFRDAAERAELKRTLHQQRFLCLLTKVVAELAHDACQP